MIIQDKSGTINHVGGKRAIANATEIIFSERPAYQPDALITYYVGRVIQDGRLYDNQIIAVWNYDDGAVVIGAWESALYDCEACQDTGFYYPATWVETPNNYCPVCGKSAI